MNERTTRQIPEEIPVIARIGIPVFGALSMVFAIFLITFLAIRRMKYGFDYMAVLYLVTAISWFMCGIGAIKKKQWGRKGLIFLSAIYVFDSYERPSFILKAFVASEWIALSTLAIGTAFFIAVIVFFCLPRVKGVFDRRGVSVVE